MHKKLVLNNQRRTLYPKEKNNSAKIEKYSQYHHLQNDKEYGSTQKYFLKNLQNLISESIMMDNPQKKESIKNFLKTKIETSPQRVSNQKSRQLSKERFIHSKAIKNQMKNKVTLYKIKGYASWQIRSLTNWAMRQSCKQNAIRQVSKRQVALGHCLYTPISFSNQRDAENVENVISHAYLKPAFKQIKATIDIKQIQKQQKLTLLTNILNLYNQIARFSIQGRII